MGTVTVRQLDDETKARLRIRAAQNGHSMEQEARDILRTALLGSTPPEEHWVDTIRRRFSAIGFADDLVIPPREPMRPPITFDS